MTGVAGDVPENEVGPDGVLKKAPTVESVVDGVLLDMVSGVRNNIVTAILELPPVEQARVIERLLGLRDETKRQVLLLGVPKLGDVNALLKYIDEIERRATRIVVTPDGEIDKVLLEELQSKLNTNTVCVPVEEFFEIFKQIFEIVRASQSDVSRDAKVDRTLINHILSDTKSKVPTKWTSNMLKLKDWCLRIISAQLKRAERVV